MALGSLWDPNTTCQASSYSWPWTVSSRAEIAIKTINSTCQLLYVHYFFPSLKACKIVYSSIWNLETLRNSMLSNVFMTPTQIWCQRWWFFHQGQLYSKAQKRLFPPAQSLLALHLKFVRWMFVASLYLRFHQNSKGEDVQTHNIFSLCSFFPSEEWLNLLKRSWLQLAGSPQGPHWSSTGWFSLLPLPQLRRAVVSVKSSLRFWIVLDIFYSRV